MVPKIYKDLYALGYIYVIFYDSKTIGFFCAFDLRCRRKMMFS